MFIVTTKLSKKRAIVIIIALAMVLGAIVLLAGRRDQEFPERRVETPEDVVTFLEQLGWQVNPDPIEVQGVLIPREFSDVYLAYNDMQKVAGFDLTLYRGMDAIRHTYQILNYPDHPDGVVADVLVVNNTVIGGGIQSIHQDGFMHELRMNDKNLR
ncbi:MAG: DUF4830 domain-containing protein [Oscillospiraceae bacterium]|nr:DUF4830 domain-containing protein [Oscillospiraceae bacterium]